MSSDEPSNWLTNCISARTVGSPLVDLAWYICTYRKKQSMNTIKYEFPSSSEENAPIVSIAVCYMIAYVAIINRWV